MNEVYSLIRPELLSLKPYSSARDEFLGKAEVYIDANENPFENNINRYPDPLQRKLKERLSEIKQMNTSNIFLGNGSDEVLDLIFRLFCIPGKDEVIITPPTYGMYKVLAGINNVFIKECPLTDAFQMDIDAILKSLTRNTKILFLCSPNNPVGNVLRREDVMHILKTFPGIVVIDEAYIDFAEEEGYSNLINTFPKLIVTQTLSKAWGMAGIRLGIALANSYTVEQLNKIKPPYNVNILTQERALKELEDIHLFEANVKTILVQREWVEAELSKLPMVLALFPSDANFVLARFTDANKYYDLLVKEGIVVRNRSNQTHCENCLRLTIGLPEENLKLIQTLKKLG